MLLNMKPVNYVANDSSPDPGLVAANLRACCIFRILIEYIHRFPVIFAVLGFIAMAGCDTKKKDAISLPVMPSSTSVATTTEVTASKPEETVAKETPVPASSTNQTDANLTPVNTAPVVPDIIIREVLPLNPDDAPTLGKTPISLNSAWEKIRSHYPVLKKQQARLDEALAQQSLAVSGFLPRASIGINATRTDDPVAVFGNKLHQRLFTQADFEINNLNHPSDHVNYGVYARIEWPLFDAFQTIGSVRTSKHRVRSEQEQTHFTTMESALLTVEAYIDTILAQRLEALAWQMALDSQADLQEAGDLMRHGLLQGADYYAARTSYARLRQAHHALKVRSCTALATFNLLQGEPPTRPARLIGNFAATHATVEKKQSDWLHDALLFRSDLAAAQSSLHAQESELGREKATPLPRISAFAEAQNNTETWADNAQNYTVGVKGSIDIFDPTLDGRVKKAAATLEQMRQDEAALRDSIIVSITTASAQYDALSADLPLLEQGADDARQSVEMTQQLYRTGRKSIADLQQMRQMRLDAESAYAETQAHVESIRTRLLFLSGQLDDVQMKSIAAQMDGGGK